MTAMAQTKRSAVFDINVEEVTEGPDLAFEAHRGEAHPRHGSGAVGLRSAARWHAAESIPIPASPPDAAEFSVSLAAMRRIIDAEIAALRSQMEQRDAVRRRITFE